MLGLSLNESKPLRLLCLGAHCDDIEIGCGGTILKLATAGRGIEVYWIVFSSDDERKQEALKSADAFLSDVISKKVTVLGLRDGFSPYIGQGSDKGGGFQIFETGRGFPQQPFHSQAPGFLR